MRYLRILAIVPLVLFMVSCTPAKKEMSIEDYAKIDKEINIPDPSVNLSLVDSVSKKYGYTAEQYTSFFEKVQKDPKLKEQLGDLRLKEEKTKQQ